MRTPIGFRYSHTIGLLAQSGRGFSLPVDCALGPDGVLYVLIRRDLSSSGLLIIVYTCLLLRELEERFEAQSRASRAGIALGMSPSGIFPQVVDHRLEGATISTCA